HVHLVVYGTIPVRLGDPGEGPITEHSPRQLPETGNPPVPRHGFSFFLVFSRNRPPLADSRSPHFSFQSEIAAYSVAFPRRVREKWLAAVWTLTRYRDRMATVEPFDA